MYRLFKLRNLCLYKNTFTSNTLSAVKLPKLCTSCHNISYYETCSNGFVRYQSTRSHSLLQNTKKRKRAKRTRKLSTPSDLAKKTEVMACNNSNKNDKENEENLTKRRTSTKKSQTFEENTELTSLNKFACRDLVFSDEHSYSKEFQELDMYSPKEIEKMMKNPVFQECILEDIDITNDIDLDSSNKETSIGQQSVSELQDSINTITEDVAVKTRTVVKASQTKTAKKKKTKTIKTDSKSKTALIEKDLSKNAITQQEIAGSHNLTRLLLAYSGLCVAQSCPQNALTMLMFYRDRAKAYPNAPKIGDIRIYDCIMEGFATKANIEKVSEIFKMIKSDGLKPTIQSYVAAFECLGRMKKSVINKIKLLNFRYEMEKYGYSLNDLLNKGRFTTNQRSVVYAAIRRIERKFKPEYTPPFIQYDCPLLQELNDPKHQELLNPKNIVEDVKLDEVLHDLPKTLSEIPKTIPENIPYNLPVKFNENINVDCSLFSGVNTHIGADYVSQNTFFSPLEYKSGINMFSRIDATNSLESCLTNDIKYQNIRNYIHLKFEKLITPKKDVKVVESNVEKVANSTQQLFSQIELTKQMKTQFELEEAGFITIDSIASEPKITDEILYFRKKLEDMQEQWRRKLLQSIEQKLIAMKNRHDKNEATLVAALHSVPISDLANIALHAARALAEGSETFSQSVNVLYKDMGVAVHTRHQVLLKKRNGVLTKVSSLYERYVDWYINDYMNNKEKTINPRQYWQSLVHLDRTGASVDIEDKEWPLQLVIGVGKFLFERILFDLKVDVNSVRPTNSNINLLPAFFTVFRNQKYVIKEEPKAHPVVCRLFREAQFPKLTFPVNIIPMKCPPKPWVTPNMGGYLIINTDMVRLPPQAMQQLQRFREVPPQNLYPVVDSLNELGAVPWTVNKKILNAALEVFRSGGDSKLAVAPPPSSLAPIPPLPATATRSERAQMHYQRLLLQKRQGELYSLWCDALYRLSLANHFKDDVFWLPHNIDFRGRVYPIPPHLTHLGADLARSLLVFAEKKPLGPDGLRWLKLHLVNLTGTKKKNSIDERLEYAEEMMPEILDSADNPLKGRKWWAESEEPWQTLACCCEIANAVRSPDPEKYCTQFPVHQDGSCNGLQHYAALGRDEAGARSVNLALSERPQDVYSAVVDLVEERRKIDAENGVKVAQLLSGYIKRKVIKQTIMTTVYGVTKFGARLQISKQLKDTDFPKEHVWAASLYLTTKTFESLRTMFTSTKEIQDWFTECAKLIATVREQNVEWVTPLGLPIVQHYVRYTKSPKTDGKVRENFTMDTKVACPNVMKQKNAFPPNFIHSLDSTHMMLTSLFSERAGITFVSVHDCFWTHPSTVHIMNKICREQFVALHSQPILEDLSNFLYKTCSFRENNLPNDGSVSDNSKRRLNKILRKLPAKGTFDLNSVLDSVYFFS